ncbi:MAG: hypothetical protein A3F41_04630 [Coxiella sp. RIFCSPHIGHO2_12_FULL_44_14]|nr:MAG: hypothetical protein A3F41_04630 [Coxiella sp. RIFCSPHIGHO2_12_FULL_44_14]
MQILVTGAAGFIGFHLTKKLCERGDTVTGVDNLNDYYDPQLKHARLEKLREYRQFEFVKQDIADRVAMEKLFSQHPAMHVVHLAAQAGVRYSLTNPYAYIDSNLVGFGNILENCRQTNVKNLVFASSSSVYGANQTYPFAENHTTDHPVALYGATKKANEMMAHSYAHLYHLPCTGLRFFTVYGPWGRPDMALFKFTENILAGKPIDVFNQGKMARDFTYIDDIIEGVIRAIDHPAKPNEAWDGVNPDSATSYAPYRIFNIGRGHSVELMTFIEIIEKELGMKAHKKMSALQAGDVPQTFADTKNLEDALGYKPKISVEEGVKRFLAWYRDYYSVS